jgi:uncharacterized protein (TIGR02646 family)
MRQIERLPLSEAAMVFLWERRLLVVEAGDKDPGQRANAQYIKASALWNAKDNKAFKEIRAVLRLMAPGHEFCVYCELDHGSTIDHFCPMDEDPTLAFAWDNYFLACFDCNSVYKRTQFPRDRNGVPLLVHPVRDDPREHLQFTPADGKVLGCTPKGEETVKVLGFDRRGNLDGTRKWAWRNVQRLIVDYADACAANDDARALAAQHDLCRHPHGSLLGVLVDVIGKPGGNLLVQEPRCAAILAAYPEIRSWP